MAEAVSEALDERLTELEIKFSYSQETIENLSEQVSKQWKVIDKLTHQLGMMHEQMATLAEEVGKPQDEPPPPHY